MVAFAIKEFGGEIPRTQGRNLPNNNAEQAANCDLSSGNLEGLPIPQLVVDLSATPGTQRAYRYPVEGDADVWLPLPSPYSSVCRSPLANDTSQRLFWTNPVGSSAPGAWWNTRARIAAGDPPYNLGVIQPDPTTAPTVVVTGGTLGGPISLAAVLSGGLAYAAGDTGTILGASGDATYTVTSIVGAPVTGATVLIGGTGYAVGDTGIIKGATGDATYIVLTVSTGVVSTLSVSSPGTLYTTGVYNTVTGGAQPGAGSGLTLGVTVSAPGVVATILLSDAGTDYVGGTYATATGGSQPGLGTGLTLTVTAVLEIPEVTRSYCWTYVNQYGEESAPSGPSAPVTGASNGTWVVSGLPTTAPTNPAGINYPPTTGVNLYRTVTGATTVPSSFRWRSSHSLAPPAGLSRLLLHSPREPATMSTTPALYSAAPVTLITRLWPPWLCRAPLPRSSCQCLAAPTRLAPTPVSLKARSLASGQASSSP